MSNQIKDEKRRIEDEKRKIEDEKRRIEDEKRKIEDEKRRIENKKRRIEDEKRRIEDEKRMIKDEKRKIEDEKRKIQDEKRKIKDEKHRIEDEIKCRNEDEKRRAVMKELIKTAKIYYGSCSSDVRHAARKFFEDIDHKHEEKVDLQEFLVFMIQEGHKEMNSRNFFEFLDWKGSKNLGFDEVRALFYIILSGRPFCSCCREFIPGMYFTCSKCYQRDNNNVIFLCPECFDAGKYPHSHKRDLFLDNYALLAFERKQRIDRARTQLTQQRQVQRTPRRDAASTSREIVTYVQPHHGRGQVQRTPRRDAASTSREIVTYVQPHHGRGHMWKSSLEALKLVANAAIVLVSLTSHCTIM